MDDLFANTWYLTGPTAAGKTAVGIELARLIGAEIISLDSMALYRGMDIGTAKPTPVEREGITHHLIDILDPSKEFSVAQYLELSSSTAAEIRTRGSQVLFVGGTALYLKALLRGLFSGPPADWELRRELEDVARLEGPAALHARLARIDPDAAGKLHINDVRRVIRALEVHQTTGRPISALQEQFSRGRDAADCRVFVLDWPRECLDQRIRRRVDRMFAAGFVDEVRRLTSSGRALSRTASQAVGYREVIEYFSGERNLAETIELIKLRTRQFAKRQLTWFRSLSECRWIPVTEPFDALQIAGIGSQTSAVPAQTNLSDKRASN
jgi:tRNA dimethylallyltransferase